MASTRDYTLSVVVPLYNESGGLEAFHASLLATLKNIGKSYEIIYIDDGSQDSTTELISNWNEKDSRVKLIKFSRNFGKENALTAGITEAKGHAVLMLDGDGQHPVELLPEFVKSWQSGAKVVVGLRTNDSGDGLFKRLGSRFFYRVFNKITGEKLIPGSTDFRLIDTTVQQAFLDLKETDRITRGLIDWLGFKQSYIAFESKARADGAPGYSNRKLMSLALNSIVSLSPMPLYLFGYLGIFITLAALFLGGSVFIEQLVLGDPWHWKFTGTAMLSILLLFLVGVVLLSQGLLSLYISHIHSQSKHRPLYVIDYEQSAGIGEEKDD